MSAFYYNFVQFYNENQLFKPGSRILLALSGGIDSMVLMHLLAKSDIHLEIAHCNFRLRGSESDDDEKFVVQQAEKRGIPVHVKKFDTQKFAKDQKLSLQMAARDLRYNWFRELKKTHQFNYIAVAHNRDDVLETFFINLGRGTGIKGLASIHAVTEDIIRPLLFASRKDIVEFCTQEDIPYREDSSNRSDKYIRNFIRHKILPSFEEVFPSFRDTLSDNIDRIKELADLYDFSINKIIPELFEQHKISSFINIEKLLSYPAPKTVLFEILTEFGFTPSSIDEIYHSCFGIPGKQFYSPSYKLVKDRNIFIISKLEEQTIDKIYIEEGIENLNFPITLELTKFEKTEDFTIDKEKNIAFIDYQKIEFPLILRKWKPGDSFTPLGMKGIKKLSDFFIDEKFSLIEKDNTWLLTSGPEIIWIVGKRIDNRFKITQNTNQILKIQFKPNFN